MNRADARTGSLTSVCPSSLPFVGSDLRPDELLFPVSGKVPGGIERKTSDFLLCQDQQVWFADFHANRHTFIANLGRVRVSPKTAQTLARHTDIRLSMNVYTHTDLAEKSEAVRRLPGLWDHSGSAPKPPKWQK